MNTAQNALLLERIRAATAIAGDVPCLDHLIEPTVNCIDLQLKQHNARARGYHKLDPDKMCRTCACLWHLNCARNFTLGVR